MWQKKDFNNYQKDLRVTKHLNYIYFGFTTSIMLKLAKLVLLYVGYMTVQIFSTQTLKKYLKCLISKSNKYLLKIRNFGSSSIK